MVGNVSQQLQNFVQNGWAPAAEEAIGMEGLEIAGAAALGGPLAIGAGAIVAGSVVSNVVNNWHTQNNVNLETVHQIQQQAQHNAGNGRAPLRSGRDLNTIWKFKTTTCIIPSSTKTPVSNSQ